jgi:hypothetical protein
MRTFSVCLAVALVAAAEAATSYTYNIAGPAKEFNARATAPSACGPSNAGEAYYDMVASELKVCDGSDWISSDSRKIQTGSSAPTACAAGTAGTIYFDSASKALKVCDGISWEEIAMKGANTLDAPVPETQMALLPAGTTSNYRKDGAFKTLALRGNSNLAKNWEIEIYHGDINWGLIEFNIFEAHMYGGFLNTAWTGSFRMNYYCDSHQAYTSRPLDTQTDHTNARFEVYRKKPFNNKLFSLPGTHPHEYGTEYSKDHCDSIVIKKIAATTAYGSTWFIEIKFHQVGGDDLVVTRWAHDA